MAQVKGNRVVTDKYILHLEAKIIKIRKSLKLAEDLCGDQSNGMTESSICIAALRDIRRLCN